MTAAIIDTQRTFLLEQHTELKRLRSVFDKFRDRVSEERVLTESEEEFYTLIQSMQNALNSMESSRALYLIYWPREYGNDYRQRLCLFDKSFEESRRDCQPFHLVHLSVLIQNLVPGHNQFTRCYCRNHSKNIRLDWSEFAYSQFISIILSRYSREIQLSSRQTSGRAERLALSLGSSGSGSNSDTESIPVSISRKRGRSDKIYPIVHHKLNYSIVVNRGVDLLREAETQFFNESSVNLCESYNDPGMAVFGRESLTAYTNHLSYRELNSSDYKFIMGTILHQCKIRASSVKRHSQLSIKSTAYLGKNWYLCVSSSCTIQIPWEKKKKKEEEGIVMGTTTTTNTTPHSNLISYFTIYTVSTGKKYVIDQNRYSRRIDLENILGDNEKGSLCLIVSCSRLVVQFNDTDDGRILFSTPGQAKLTLRGDSVSISIWATDESILPVRYEVADQLDELYHSEPNHYFNTIHRRYHALMQQRDLNTNYNITLPSCGYTENYIDFRVDQSLPLDHRNYSIEHFGAYQLKDLCGRPSPQFINQYGSSFENFSRQEVVAVTVDEADEISLKAIDIYYNKKGEANNPFRFTYRITQKRELPLLITPEYYMDRGRHSIIFGLRLTIDSPPLCHYILSSNRKFIIFIKTITKRLQMPEHLRHLFVYERG